MYGKRLLDKIMKKQILIADCGFIGHADIGKTTLTEKLAMTLNNKVDVIVIDETKPHNSFEVNGELYVPIETEETKAYHGSRGISKLAAVAAMMYQPYMDLLDSRYDRKLPKGTDIITEYGLIQQKKSKLSKWERDDVVFKFNKHFRKL